MNRLLDAVPGVRRAHERWLGKNLELPTVRLPSRDPGLRGLKIALLSDLHVGSYLGAGMLAEVCRRTNALEPDLICITGDLINSRASELRLLHEGLSVLEAPLGVYAVPGNHDCTWSNVEDWQRTVHDAGVTVLWNAGRELGFGSSRLWLAGVDDYGEGVPDLDAALSGRRTGAVTVLMAHHPDYFAKAMRSEVDLTLSGHTHGGQVRFGDWIPMRHTQLGYDSGSFEVAERHLLVSAGVGATLLPIRWGTRPQVPCIAFV